MIDREGAFEAYLVTRDYAQTAKAIGAKTRQIQRWAVKDDWAGRLAAHDAAIAAEANPVEPDSDKEEIETEVANIRKLRRALLKAIARSLRTYVGPPDKLVNAHAALVKSERALMGEPVDQTKITLQQIIQQNQEQWLELHVVQEVEEPEEDDEEDD